MQFSQKILLFAKLTSESGKTTINATNAILASEASLQPFVAETLERKYYQGGHWGAHPHIYTGQHAAIEFTIELTGMGSKNAELPFHALLLACGLKVNKTASQAVYTPQTSPANKLELRFHQDNFMHQLSEARGSFSLTYEPNQFPKLKFKFLGLYSTPTEAQLPAAEFHEQKPLLCGGENLHSFTMLSQSAETPFLFELDLGNTISLHKSLQQDSIEFFQRQVVGRLVWAAKKSNHYFEKNEQAELGNLVLQHGKAAKEIIKINCPKIQLKDLNYGDQSGELTFESSFSALPENGDDELSITFA